MSDLTDAFDELRTAFQEVSDSEPTLTYLAQSADLLPNAIGFDETFVHGGIGESSEFDVSCLESEFASVPPERATVALAGHANAPDGNYSVKRIKRIDGVITFTLGDFTTE